MGNESVLKIILDSVVISYIVLVTFLIIITFMCITKCDNVRGKHEVVESMTNYVTKLYPELEDIKVICSLISFDVSNSCTATGIINGTRQTIYAECSTSSCKALIL